MPCRTGTFAYLHTQKPAFHAKSRLDAGINFIDTADVYSAGESEEIVGEALRGRRDDIIVATKSYFSVQDGPAVSRPRLNSSGSSRRHIVRACEDSLQRLGTDWIDLYQVHRIDYATDIDDTLGALSDLVHAGKIRAIGTSSFSAARIVEAQWTSERRNRERFACEQPQYSMFVREIEQEVLSTCQRFGMGVIVWSPLNAGWLSGARRRSSGSDGITRVVDVEQVGHEPGPSGVPGAHALHFGGA
jgi:aryl-alcohol dehydrogenase-like predicted oxidoreductase